MSNIQQTNNYKDIILQFTEQQYVYYSISAILQMSTTIIGYIFFYSFVNSITMTTHRTNKFENLLPIKELCTHLFFLHAQFWLALTLAFLVSDIFWQRCSLSSTSDTALLEIFLLVFQCHLLLTIFRYISWDSFLLVPFSLIFSDVWEILFKYVKSLLISSLQMPIHFFFICLKRYILVSSMCSTCMQPFFFFTLQWPEMSTCHVVLHNLQCYFL